MVSLVAGRPQSFLSVNLLISLIVGAGESNDGLVKVCAFSLFFGVCVGVWLRKNNRRLMEAYPCASISGGYFFCASVVADGAAGVRTR